MPDDAQDEATRQSSPRFPFIGLAKAVRRAEALRLEAGPNLVPVAEARKIWGFAEKSSGGDQTIAALGYYGMLQETGSGTQRRIKLSDLAIRYLREERSEVRSEMATKMVQTPKAMQMLWKLWGHSPPSPPIARSILKNDLNFSDSAADQVFASYVANLPFFPSSDSDTAQDEEQAEATSMVEQQAGLVTGDRGKVPTPPPTISGTRRAVFTLMGGNDVTLTFPADLDASEFAELEGYLQLFLNNGKRQYELKAQEVMDRGAFLDLRPSK